MAELLNTHPLPPFCSGCSSYGTVFAISFGFGLGAFELTSQFRFWSWKGLLRPGSLLVCCYALSRLIEMAPIGILSSPLSFDSGLGRVCYDLALFWCAVTHLVV